MYRNVKLIGYPLAMASDTVLTRLHRNVRLSDIGLRAVNAVEHACLRSHTVDGNPKPKNEEIKQSTDSHTCHP